VKEHLQSEIKRLEKKLVDISNKGKKLFTDKKNIKKEYLSVFNELENKKHGLKKLKKKKTSPKK
jgi:DNA-binding PadR family transcriptional regulator